MATLGATVQYMGFWIRLVAALIDGIIFFGVLCFIGPLIYILIHRAPALPPLYFFLPFLYHWLFTGLRGQTLGKMVCGIKVVNTEGSVPGLVLALLREFPGKILATIPTYLGYLWIIWDGQKQGWHDKIANTYVVRVESRR